MHKGRKLAGVFGAGVMMAVSTVLATSAPAVVVDDHALAFVWAFDDSAGAPYTPSVTEQSFNSNDAVNRITRTDVGEYTVRFGAMANGLDGGSAFVSAEPRRSCTIVSWVEAGAAVDLRVRCFDLTGARTDAQFTAGFTTVEATGSTNVDFAWADRPKATNYRPHTFYQETRAGAPIKIKRLSAGNYLVQVPGGLVSDIPMVTPYSAGYRTCDAAAPVATATGLEVSVTCRGRGTTPRDARFAFQLAGVEGLFGDITQASSVYQNRAAASGNVPLLHSVSTIWPSATSTRLGRGNYRVEIAGPTPFGVPSTAFVTPASAGRRCAVVSWNTGTDPHTAEVVCYNARGRQADARFFLHVSTVD